MAKYIICKNCRALVEYNPKIRYEGGTSYSYFRCPRCDYATKTSVSHIHYGEDGKR